MNKLLGNERIVVDEEYVDEFEKLFLDSFKDGFTFHKGMKIKGGGKKGVKYLKIEDRDKGVYSNFLIQKINNKVVLKCKLSFIAYTLFIIPLLMLYMFSLEFDISVLLQLFFLMASIFLIIKILKGKLEEDMIIMHEWFSFKFKKVMPSLAQAEK